MLQNYSEYVVGYMMASRLFVDYCHCYRMRKFDRVKCVPNNDKGYVLKQF